MSALHRVYLAAPLTPSTDEGVPCPRCGHHNRIGLANCARCRSALFPHQPREARGVSIFSRMVKCGEDMPAVTGYLRRNGYPIGESPEHCWRRKRRQLAREIRRKRKGLHDE